MRLVRMRFTVREGRATTLGGVSVALDRGRGSVRQGGGGRPRPLTGPLSTADDVEVVQGGP